MSSLDGKIVVITGASSGIGAAAARELRRRGASVVPVGRSPQKTAALCAELGVRGHSVDFTRLDEVRRLAHDLLSTLPRIDVLAANAGGIPADRQPTSSGIEPIFQVNTLGPWLLMRLLAPRLTGGRVIATSSRSHTGATLSSDTLARISTSTAGLGHHNVYARAKLASGILLREFGRRHPQVVVADFHPGIITSDFGRYLGAAGAALKVLAAPFLDTPAQGAQRLVHLAMTERDIHGKYFVSNQPAAGSPLLNDCTLGIELWTLAERLASR
ncbi:SDR family NAD(P)-dependent oxidoreductase [Sorangium sp. So ce281]|uniref:SDR family NAD(P)-dependent oxidoreductase n=1 Tax=unclassified Sorangium TaxID=2621164 RepID=UPI003F6000E7